MSALLAAAKPGTPVGCTLCTATWPQDPPFEVECPTCHAKPGAYCRRPSGHSGPFVPFHAARDLAALDAGAYGDRCTCPSEPVPSPADAQPSLFELQT